MSLMARSREFIAFKKGVVQYAPPMPPPPLPRHLPLPRLIPRPLPPPRHMFNVRL
jgi:hypothetical protein